MKTKKHAAKTAAKSGLLKAIDKATGMKRTKRGPEPERFKIEGYADWKDAVKVALRKPKPPEGWPK